MERYFEVSPDRRPLVLGDGNTPLSIGGRNTEFTRIAEALERQARVLYGSALPPDVLEALQCFRAAASEAEATLKDVVEVFAAVVLERGAA